MKAVVTGMDKSKFVSRKTKKVDGVDLSLTAFAYVGNAQDTKTWKLPICFRGDEAKTVNHIKDALARFDETKAIPGQARRDTWLVLRGAAMAHGLPVPHKSFATTAEEKNQTQAEVKAQELSEPKPESRDALAESIAEADALADKMLRKLGFQ
jgi:hypothetical protein